MNYKDVVRGLRAMGPWLLVKLRESVELPPGVKKVATIVVVAIGLT